MVVYFSGTGNSKYVAERIAGSLQEKLLCMNEQIKSGDTGTDGDGAPGYCKTNRPFRKQSDYQDYGL